jgi:hypothetical protein
MSRSHEVRDSQKYTAFKYLTAMFALALAAGCGSGFATATGHKHKTSSPGPTFTATLPTAVPTAPATPQPTVNPLRQVHDPGQVTGALRGPCHAMESGQLPDPSCTPGAYDPSITAAKLCAPGYHASDYRPPPSQAEIFKYTQAYPAYHLLKSTRSELDHLVPLELGGANDAANLWPEAGTVPNSKDSIETMLHKWVCTALGGPSQLRLRKAQVAIAIDWMSAEKKLGIR